MAYSLNPNDHMLTIRGRQVVNGEEDGETVYTQCRYKRAGEALFIAYDSVEEGPDKGVPITTRNLLRIEGSDRVTLRRSGAGSGTQLILQKGQRHNCCYATPFGSFTLGIYTAEIENHLTEAGGTLHVRYTLDFNLNQVSENELFITIKEVAKPHVEESGAGKNTDRKQTETGPEGLRSRWAAQPQAEPQTERAGR